MYLLGRSLINCHQTLLTGCDTTSYICGHTKRSAWEIFLPHHQLLCDVGVGTLTQIQLKSVETFVCKLYGVDNVGSVDIVRRIKFEKSCKAEMLPPTSDALRFHILRVHYQCIIWKNAHCPVPHLPDVTQLGWKRDTMGLQPILMTLDPILQACLEMISCSCQSRCQTLRCKLQNCHAQPNVHANGPLRRMGALTATPLLN